MQIGGTNSAILDLDIDIGLFPGLVACQSGTGGDFHAVTNLWLVLPGSKLAFQAVLAMGSVAGELLWDLVRHCLCSFFG